MNCSPPGSSIHGILQARILEWVAKRIKKVKNDFLKIQMKGLSRETELIGCVCVDGRECVDERETNRERNLF